MPRGDGRGISRGGRGAPRAAAGLALLALASGLAACGSATPPAEPPPPEPPAPEIPLPPLSRGPALVVVGNRDAPSAGDRVILDRLRGVHRYEVTVVSDEEPVPADPGRFAVVLLSPTARASELRDRYRELARPVVALAAESWAAMGMASGAAPSTTGVVHLRVVDEVHPLAGWMNAGRHEFTFRRDFLRVAQALNGATAARVVSLPDDPRATVGFAYAAGVEMMEGFVAPARRVGLGISDKHWAVPISSGRRLLDAAVRYAAEGTALPDPTPGPAEVLVVVDDPSAPNPSEAGILERLRARGYTAELVDDDVWRDAFAVGRRLVVLTDNAQLEPLEGKLREARCGVIMTEYETGPDVMGLRLPRVGGHYAGTKLDVEDSRGHPLAAGFTRQDDLVVYERSGVWQANDLSWAAPDRGNSDLILIAANEHGSRDVHYFAYDAGATLDDGRTAAGRRVYFFLYRDTFTQLTDPGLRLWDAAVDWAGGRED